MESTSKYIKARARKAAAWSSRQQTWQDMEISAVKKTERENILVNSNC